MLPSVKWVKPESLHITPKFLGEVPESRLQELQSRLQSVSGSCFPQVLKGTGFFPSAKIGPRLLDWRGCSA